MLYEVTALMVVEEGATTNEANSKHLMQGTSIVKTAANFYVSFINIYLIYC